MARDDRKAKILERTQREKVKFMRLQFTDILGALKNVEVPDRQFAEFIVPLLGGGSRGAN